MNDLRQRIANLSPAQRALLEQRLLQQRSPAIVPHTIPRRTTTAPCTASFAQQRLWFLWRFAPQSPLYNESRAFRLHGTLNVTALQQALTIIVARHEALRTVFAPDATGQPLQVIVPPGAIALPVVDVSSEPDETREGIARRHLLASVHAPFDLAQDLLLRVLLVRLAPEEHIVLLVTHHIASDAWSGSILLRELALAYDAYTVGQSPALPELPIQYADYAEWQRQQLQGDALTSLLTYWQQQLASPPEVLALPTDRPWPAVQTYTGKRYTWALPTALSEALQALGRQHQATLFMTLLAAFYILLYRYTGQSDLIVGSPIAGRVRQEVEGLIGFFINTLLLRGNLSGAPTFSVLLERVRTVTLEAYGHQALPFEKLVEALQPERHLSHAPLCQVLFALQNVPRQPFALAGVRATAVDIHSDTAKFPLIVFMHERADTLYSIVEYNADLFDTATIERFCGHFQTLLAGIVHHPEQPITTLPLLTAAERQQILVDWNATQTPYPRTMTIAQLFVAQAQATPDAVALLYGTQQLTYRQLNTQANQLAHLLQQHGVSLESFVGVCLERSLDLVVALLAIVKASGVYVPLDPTYPHERLAFMLQDSGITTLLTMSHLLPALPSFHGTLLCLDRLHDTLVQAPPDDLPCKASAEHLAYVMYTSGSTGQPKGVRVPHQGVVRLVKDTNYVTLTSDDVFLHLASIAFDASTFELWGALLNGARLVIFPPYLPALDELGKTIQHHHVSTLWLPAGLFHQMVDGNLPGLRGVRQLLTGGDVVSVPHAQRLLRKLPGCTLINGYGPTENTTFTCCYPMTTAEQIGLSVPLGPPIANTSIYILDEHGEPVPVGVPGELYVGGDGLARGYLRRPELNAERFVTWQWHDVPATRLYRTGDRVRWRLDGTVEFLGRLDEQVKIRGFRIEPGEIETILGQYPGIQDSTVSARTDTTGDKRLIAYYVATTELPSTDLRAFLQSKLPDYMIPSAFVQLAALPLTAHGKVDRQALPAPEQTRSHLGQEFQAPRDRLEGQLAYLWETLLGVHPIGIHDNFFACGGHSLLAVRLLTQMEKLCHRELSLATLFQAPTIAAYAALLRQDGLQPTESSLLPYRPTGSKPLLFCVHGTDVLCRYMDAEQPFYAIHPYALDGRRAPTTVPAMAATYLQDIQALQPQGPYFLSGVSIGGLIAFEMAYQLQQQGHTVALVTLIDPTVPGRSHGLSVHSHFKGLYNRLAMLGSLMFLARDRRVPRWLRLRYFLASSLHAAQDYTPPLYPGRVVLLQAHQGLQSHADLWARYVTGVLETYEVPGDHASMVQEPHVQTLAARFTTCLEAVYAQDPDAATTLSTQHAAD